MTEDLPMMSAMPDAALLLAPERIAPAALFLASDRAADITYRANASRARACTSTA